MRKTNALQTQPVTGSLQDYADNNNISVADAFLHCEVVVLIDQSGSMEEDAYGGMDRFEAADKELFALQRQHPGQLAVVSFSDDVEFNANGIPNRRGSGTDMAQALTFAMQVDGLAQIILISDGQPNDEQRTLAVARNFRHPIHTIYIGPENDKSARDFLNQLARVTGGQPFVAEKGVSLLTEGVQYLLTG